MTTTTARGTKLQNEELKDAYRTWLKDLHDDKPERLLQKLGKKKQGGGRRTCRNKRIEHAQKHTAASALKDIALKEAKQAKLPALYVPADKQVIHDARRRRHQVLVDEANYSGVQYLHQPSWRPGLAFFQQLAHRVLLKGMNFGDEANAAPPGIASSELSGFPVRIAPVLLRVPLRRSDRLGNRLGVALLYCQEQTQEDHLSDEHADSSSFMLVCRVYYQESSWREHRSALLGIISNPSAEVYAVRKRSDDFECRNNDLHFLRSRQEVEHAIDGLWIDSTDIGDEKIDYTSELMGVQKYIPFKGATSSASTSTTSIEPPTERKAWIARCASRKRDNKSSTVWIISGGDAHNNEGSSLVTSSSSANCQLTKCTIDQAWSEPRLLASMCMISLEKAMQVRFTELVIDLLQDSSGNWWLLQVKAFSFASLRPVSALTVSSRSTSLLQSKMTQSGLSRTQSAPNRFDESILPTPQWRKWRCAGRYCTLKCTKKAASDPAKQESIDGDENNDDAKEPPGYLTKKVLRSCEFFDEFVRQQDMSLAGGFTEFQSALSFHLQHRLPKRDRSQLYEPQPLCSMCLRRYHSLRQQWTQAVGTPKVATTSNLISGARQKSRSKSSNEYVDHPRKLPSLHHDSGDPSSRYSSYSTSALSLDTKNQKPSLHESSVSNRSAYLDELAAVEEMLAGHEPHSILVKTTSTSQTRKQKSSTVTATTTVKSVSSSPEDLFPKWDGETRIEAMWQNLALKPLERQLSAPSVDANGIVATKNGYNSISLHQELMKAANLNKNSLQNDQQDSPEMTITENELQNNAVTKPARIKALAAHTIPVHHCRQIFEDEIYREQLVNDALSVLQSGTPNVCFVVAPRHRIPTSPSSNKQRPREDEDELAEMALRSLYIDVKQAIVATSEMVPEVQLSSWPMRANVHREASGCMTVRLGPA